uniref:Histone deacetylase 10 n=1 Tax=Leptobrachium leishanense TaxID=445787 RepID=A0A8C5MC91_9ANUR
MPRPLLSPSLSAQGEEAMASGTALIYDDEMTTYKLLWDDPVCAIEVPERLSRSYERLQHYGLAQRCVRLPVREATDQEITLVHSPEYLEVVKSTQTMNEEELQKTSEKYTAVYFHQNSYRCAKLSLGGALQLVDAVLSGDVRNGMALVRPPGHHSYRDQGNGFCVFNNVAVAAKYAQKKYNLQRILIVDWDVHHGQGIQYTFEDDPSVLYFSWHRYEHMRYWPNLSESNYDAVGKGKGAGFNVNLPWNKIGMGNADYIAAFLHVLLPVTFEFDPDLVLVSAGYDSGIGDPEGCMRATPECFSHLTHLLMNLARGKLCAVLEGGYHLRSLSESVCTTVRTLLGDAVPGLTGEMAPCYSALESMQNVQAALAPYWQCLSLNGIGPVTRCSTEDDPAPEPVSAQQQCADTAATDHFLELHMKDILRPAAAVTTSAVIPDGLKCVLPAGVQIVKQSAPSEQIDAAFSAFTKARFNNSDVLHSAGKMLTVLSNLKADQTRNAVVLSPDASLSAAVALRETLLLGFERVFCVHVGDTDPELRIGDDGKSLFLRICGALPAAVPNTKYQLSLKWTETSDEGSGFFYPLLRFVLPLGYSYRPDVILLAVGSNASIGSKDILLLASLLQGLAEGRILAIIPEWESELTTAISSSLVGCPTTKHLGPYKCPTKECVDALKEEQRMLQVEWELLRSYAAD